MKFNCINVHNIHELVPHWAIDPFALAKHLDGLFSSEQGSQLAPAPEAVYSSLPFWVEVDTGTPNPIVRVCTPDDQVNLNGRLIITCQSLLNEKAQIELPLNPIFKGYEKVERLYSVYLHSFQTETPLGYVGMTKQRWFDRLAQHTSSARNGSPYLFHRALREHRTYPILHKVFVCGLNQDNAMELEEEWVGMCGLYPLGLNMIAGGKAGLVYLSKLGVQARTTEEKDSAIERLSSREHLEGRPNPLCASRWESDADFVERVICGHSGRLSVEQVRLIRLGASLNKSVEELVEESGARNVRQIKRLLSKKTYGRVKHGI